MSSLAIFQPLTSHAIGQALCTKTLGRSLHIVDEAPSTNTLALALAQDGAADGTVVVAEAQTQGRGRRGREWYSPPRKNLYCSIILRRPVPQDGLSAWLSWVPLLSAVAAARAVQVLSGVRPSLKWPNDIVIEGRKVGGLLCESSGTGTGNLVVIVGIGLNVNLRRNDFPEALRALATSLAAESGRPYDRAVLLSTLLSELELRYDAFCSHGISDIKQEYELRCSSIGQHVRVDMADGACIEGRAKSIGDDGALEVIVDSPHDQANRGTVVAIRAGDVVHLRRRSN